LIIGMNLETIVLSEEGGRNQQLLQQNIKTT